MLDCSFIDKQTYQTAVETPLSATRDGAKQYSSSYLNAVFDEFEELNIDPYGQFSELNIKTYLNSSVQQMLDGQSADCDYSYFVRNNAGGVVAFKSSLGNVKRQIGSTAKPIFVYAPALNDKKINIFTKISDEPVNYGGYSPENFDKKYHGRVSVADSIKYSYNIPAVKTLNSLNFDAVESYASKMNITLSAEDKNLALALGGMKDGLTLKELCDAYSVFPNGGNFTTSHFIKEICDQSGNVLYSDKQSATSVFTEGTCSLINDVLCETAKTGTAKKLKEFDFDVACKTGTCGNKDGNTDAYSIAYTADICAGVWLGDKDNNRLQITGGKDCCNIVKDILQSACNENSGKLDKSSGTKIIEIDREEYENNDKILLCDAVCPKLNRLKVKALSDNLPNEQSTRFSCPAIKKPSILVNNNQICISLCQTKYYSYLIKRGNDVIYDGEWKKDLIDEPSDGNYEYSVTPYYSADGKVYYGNTINLPRIIIKQEKTQDKLPDIAFKDWYNQ